MQVEDGIAHLVQLRLLGRFGLTVRSEPYRFNAPPRTLPLLAYVLLHRTEAVARDELAFLLWPDESETTARTNLRRHLLYLQRALPDCGAPWLECADKRIRWNPASPCWIDVAAFEELSAAPQTQTRAVVLYGGDLLERIYDDWVIVERERLRNMQLANLTSLVTQRRIARDYAQALDYAQRLLALDPWREDAVRNVISLRALLGDRAGAMDEYHRFAERLFQEMNVAPMPETLAAYESVVADAPVELAREETDALEPSCSSPRGMELPFVGRGAELERLHAGWSRAARGHGGLVFVSGEAGIGKSRLVHALAELARAEGGRVIVGESDYGETTPYSVFVSALRTAIPLVRSALQDAEIVVALGTLLPDFGRGGAAGASVRRDAESERLQLFEAFAAAFRIAAETRPVLLVLEDVHRSSPVAIDLLDYLTRRLVDHPILVVATYREDDMAPDHALRALRRRRTPERSVRAVALRPLTSEDIAAIVRETSAPGTPVAEIASQLHAGSEGNPFFLSELIRDWRESGRIDSCNRTIESTLRNRLQRLSADAQRLASLAAAIGDGFDVDLLSAVSGWTEGTVIGTLDELLDRHIVRDAGLAEFEYAFSHHLVQAAIYAATDAETLKRRHRRIGRLLMRAHQDAPHRAGYVASHLDRGGEPELAARAYLQAADFSLSAYANEEAATYATRGLDLATAAADRARLRLAREEARRRVGDHAAQRSDLDALASETASLGDSRLECEVLARSAAYCASRGDDESEAAAIELLVNRARKSADERWIAASLLAAGARSCRRSNFREADTMLREAAARFHALDDVPGEMACLLELIVVPLRAGDPDGCRTILERARTLIAGSADLRLHAKLEFAAYRVATTLHDIAGAYACALREMELSQRIGDIASVADAHRQLGGAAHFLFRYAQAFEHLDRAQALYEQCGNELGCIAVLRQRSRFESMTGLFDEALVTSREGERRATTKGMHLETIGFIGGVALALAGIPGREREARDEAARALASTSPEWPIVQGEAFVNLGTIERDIGEHGSAVSHLERGVAIFRELRRPMSICDALSELVVAYVCVGRIDDARTTADELIGVTRGLDDRLNHYWLFCAARGFEAANEREIAASLMRRAEELLRTRADAIPDEAFRARYLAIASNRELLMASARA